MHVMHLLDHSIPLHSGYSFRTRAILENQRALGIRTSHITSSKHYGAKELVEECDGFKFYRTFQSNKLRNRLPIINQLGVVSDLVDRLRDAVNKERPDILHAHSPCLVGLAALKVGREQGIPVVYEMRASWEDAAVDHGTTREGSLRYRLSRALETYVLRRANAITTICEGLRKEILSRGIEASSVTVVPNAVDVEKFNSDRAVDNALKSSLGLSGSTVLGFIGSFYAYEGLAMLVDALPFILKYTPNTKLLLVGGGPQNEELKVKVSEMGLDGHVIFVGRVPHDKVQAYYDLVDVFVYPRLPMKLTEMVTPLKPLEAMAQRRLVVASDVGGHRELITHQKNGMLFRARDVEDLTATVTTLLATPELWSKLRDEGRRFVENERNWAKSVANYLQIYESLVASRL